MLLGQVLISLYGFIILTFFLEQDSLYSHCLLTFLLVDNAATEIATAQRLGNNCTG